MFNAGVTGSLLLTTSIELRLPIAFGVNVMFTVQVIPMGKPVPPMGQVEVDAKSNVFPPESPKPLMINGALPTFFSVMVCGALVVPTVMLPNWNALLSGLMIGATPVPVNDTASGVGLLLAMAMMAARAPLLAGLKVTLIVQVAPARRLAPQPFVWAKSPAFKPVKVIPVTARTPAPAALVSVTVWATLVVFTAWLPKASEVGDKVILGAVPTEAGFDHAETTFARSGEFHAWEKVPAQPLSTAWIL